MGHHFHLTTGGAPFVPQSMVFPKKKARELQRQMPSLSLSEAQELIARALGWPDWFSLHEAVKKGYSPSLPDEDVSAEEVDSRYGTQMMAFLEHRVAPWQVEHLVAELALTCSRATASKRLDDIGPWGAFQEDVHEIFPGITEGQCSKFDCYRLSPERIAEVPPHIRLDTNGWYMLDDHKWRVVLSFPQYFSDDDYTRAEEEFANNEPFVYELTTGVVPKYSWGRGPSMAARRKAAQTTPDAWFALCVKPFAAFEEDSTLIRETLSTFVAGAVKGSALLQLMDVQGVWPESNPPESAWFGLEQLEAHAIAQTYSTKSNTRLSGKKGWALPQIASRPFVHSPFSPFELDLTELSPPATVLAKPSMGQPVVIP